MTDGSSKSVPKPARQTVVILTFDTSAGPTGPWLTELKRRVCAGETDGATSEVR
jgi:hypothetical protein